MKNNEHSIEIHQPIFYPFSDADVWSHSWLNDERLPSSQSPMQNGTATCGTIDVLVAPHNSNNLLRYLKKQNVELNVSMRY